MSECFITDNNIFAVQIHMFNPLVKTVAFFTDVYHRFSHYTILKGDSI